MKAADTADAVHDVAKAAKSTDIIYDSVKIADTADVYHAAKRYGTIELMLKASEDPMEEMHKLSGSIAKTSPMQIPEGAKIKPQIKEGYYQIKYQWTDADGYYYKARWHTRNPTAPLEQRDVWVIERKIKGIGHGPNARKGLYQVWVGGDEWITHAEWKKAATENQLGYATEQQKRWLKYGHWKA